MPRTRPGRLAIAGALALLMLSPRPVAAEGSSTSTVPWAERFNKNKAATSSSGSTGWWIGSVGIAGTLAVVGWVSLASKRFLPAKDSGSIRVVGRTALSPRQSVYLLRVGDRVLILGTGPQGPPSTLGEVTDPAELARLIPGRHPRPTFDQRIGDAE